MLSKSFIHIGANKTGSTTLQRSLFSKSSDLHYLGEDGERFMQYKEGLDSLVNDDDFHYKAAAVERTFYEFTRASDGRPFVFSNEDIMRSRVPCLCAKRLHTVLPDAEIIVVIRNQLTAIPSWYANHGAFLRDVPKRYWRRYVSFDDWMSYCEKFINYSPLDGFFYNEIVGLYADLFGKDRVHIFLFEEFVSSKQRFLEKLCQVLGIGYDQAASLLEGQHQRKRITQRQFRVHMLREKMLCGKTLVLPNSLSWLANRWTEFLAGGAPFEDCLNDHWRSRIIELYRKSNAQLESDYQLSLGRYGYPVA